MVCRLERAAWEKQAQGAESPEISGSAPPIRSVASVTRQIGAISTLRIATEGDCDRILEVFHVAHRWNLENGFNFDASYMDRQALARHLLAGRLYLAEADGHIVGTIKVEPGNEVDGWSFNLLAVAAEFGRGGIGKRLVRFAEVWVRANGARRLVLDTPENHPWLPAFYRRLGYHTAGYVQWSGKNYRSIYLAKDLSAGRMRNSAP